MEPLIAVIYRKTDVAKWKYLLQSAKNSNVLLVLADSKRCSNILKGNTSGITVENLPAIVIRYESDIFPVIIPPNKLELVNNLLKLQNNVKELPETQSLEDTNSDDKIPIALTKSEAIDVLQTVH